MLCRLPRGSSGGNVQPDVGRSGADEGGDSQIPAGYSHDRFDVWFSTIFQTVWNPQQCIEVPLFGTVCIHASFAAFYEDWRTRYLDTLYALNAAAFNNGIDFNEPPTLEFMAPSSLVVTAPSTYPAPPTLELVASPGSWVGSRTTLSARISDIDGFVDAADVAFSYSPDGSTWSAIPGPVRDRDEVYSTTIFLNEMSAPSNVWIRIQAWDNLGREGVTTAGSFTVDTIPPLNPTGYVALPDVGAWATMSHLQVSWNGATDTGNPQSGIWGYVVSLTGPGIDGVPDCYGVTTLGFLGYPSTGAVGIFTSSPDAEKDVFTGEWWLNVRAKDYAGNCAPESFRIGPFLVDIAPPQSIGPESPLPGSVFCDPPTLTWNSSYDWGSGLASYSLQLSREPVGPNAYPQFSPQYTRTVEGINGLSYTPQGLTQDIWYWRVRPVDNVGLGHWSIAWPFELVCGPPSPPALPLEAIAGIAASFGIGGAQ